MILHNIVLSFKNNISQIMAVTEKELKLVTRFKLPVILGFIYPFITVIMPLIIMGQLFAYRESFGAWTAENYYVFQVIAYQLTLIFGIRNRFSAQFRTEVFWQTLQALIIAPFNRINLLVAGVFCHIIMMLVPFTLFMVIGMVIVPISFSTFIFLMCVFLLILLIFSGLGLLIGGLAISKPGFEEFISLFLGILFMFSCLSYPFEFFPGFYQNIAILNPLYYIIDFTRLIWLDNNALFTIILHPLNFTLIVSFAVIFPIIGIFFFNYIFNKFGIVGY